MCCLFNNHWSVGYYSQWCQISIRQKQYFLKSKNHFTFDAKYITDPKIRTLFEEFVFCNLLHICKNVLSRNIWDVEYFLATGIHALKCDALMIFIAVDVFGLKCGLIFHGQNDITHEALWWPAKEVMFGESAKNTGVVTNICSNESAINCSSLLTKFLYK